MVTQKAALEDSTQKFVALVAALLLVMQAAINKTCISLTRINRLLSPCLM